MPASSLESVVRHLRRLHAPATDGELLSRFAADRDADAFAELARRHGPMVLGVCRRILGDAHAAVDAFQTTFLTLARYAGSLRRPAALPAWLYGVAVRNAQRVRARRRRSEHAETQRRPPSPPADPLAEVSGRELLAVIDEELARLPERYRAPLLLCGLDGLTRDETAARLGWSLGTLRGRLERGRELLRRRLTKRGLTVPTVLAASLIVDPVSAVPTELVRAVTQAALVVPVAAGSLKVLSASVVVVALGIGVGVGVTMMPGQRSEAPAAQPPPAVVDDPVARSDALDGLPDGAIVRLGSLRLRPGDGIEAVAFSPDGKHLACWAGSHSRRGNVTIWDAVTGRLERRIDLPHIELKLLHWLPDGRGVAVLKTGMNSYHVWDFADAKAPPPAPIAAEVGRGADGVLVAVTISPDGRWLATGRSATRNQPQPIEVYELAVNKPLSSLQGRVVGTQVGYGAGLVFTPDSGTLLAISRKLDPNLSFAASFDPSPAPPGEPEEQAQCIAWDVAAGRSLKAFDITAPGGFSLFATRHQVHPSFALTPDGQTLIVGQRDGHVRLWDWRAGQERRSFPAHLPGDLKLRETGGVVAVAVSGNGRRLTTFGMFGPARCWDLTTGEAVGSWPATSFPIESVVLAPDGLFLAGGGLDGQLFIRNPVTGEDRVRPIGHSGFVQHVHIQPDGRSALTTGFDGLVCHWDLANGRELRRVELEATRQVRPRMFLPDGQGLLGGGFNREIYLWDTGTGKRQPLGDEIARTNLWFLAPPVGGTVIVRDGASGTVTMRDWPSGTLRHTFAPPAHEAPANGHSARAAARSPDGRWVAVVGCDIRTLADATGFGTGRLSLFNAATGRAVHRWGTPHAYFDHVAFTPDGAGVVVGGATVHPLDPAGGLPPVAPYKAEQALQLLDAEWGEPVRTLLPPRADATAHRSITTLAVSPDGRQIAAAERDNSIWVYELATGRVRRNLTGHSNQVTDLAYTPDGRRLVSASWDLTGLVWDVSLAAGRAGPKPTPADFDSLWADLTKPEWDRAGPALATLATHADAALDLLRDRLRPADRPIPDVATIDRLVRQLESDTFAERERATAELRRMGVDAVPHLRRRASQAPTLEVRLRLEKLVKDLAVMPLPSDRLRELRAVELLEQTATPAARKLLRGLASGASGAALTDAATAALQRLEPH